MRLKENYKISKKCNGDIITPLKGNPSDNKELKSRLRIEEFNGATTVSVLQEFYINMLLSNIASLVKNQVDEELEISNKSSNKHRYQANRAFIIGRIKKLNHYTISSPSDIFIPLLSNNHFII